MDNPVNILDEKDALERLASVSLGRIVVRRSEDIDIFPVNFIVDKGDIYIRTAEGNKLFSMNLNSDVLFEADEVTEDKAWSVVVRANAEIVSKLDEIAYADTLELKPWIPTLKYNYVRLVPNEVSGREFALGEEPERY
ncbi:pyridoxamine 5'-phosphate oxidase family protein [Corynebacterium crudilactis]|uniref:Pyridoxamine 5-phosphate oxidase n=1 Tax=Corynebacterium crudilactis TaxID=1652495 RepID=A0A172QVI9_9CORY|nr:pyridoxamine 5'-phosphate oxidase family protein [Corynebacterium crudilactis]ANE04743.1 pyridoxamine 5-phosphate oxidase [Corynebacterium crudilactis]